MPSKHAAKDTAQFPESPATSASSWLTSMMFGHCCKGPPLEGELNFDDLEKKEKKEKKAKKRAARKESRGPDATDDADRSAVKADAAVKADVAKAGGPTMRRYKVDNSILKVESRPGVAYRYSKQENDKVRSECGPAKWGEIVEGISEGDGWLKVGDFYLPMLFQGVHVVTPVADSEVPPAAPPAEKDSSMAMAVPSQKAPDSGAPGAEAASFPSKPSQPQIAEGRSEVEASVETAVPKRDESVVAAMPADSIAAKLEVPLGEEPPLVPEPEHQEAMPVDSIAAKLEASPAEETNSQTRADGMHAHLVGNVRRIWKEAQMSNLGDVESLRVKETNSPTPADGTHAHLVGNVRRIWKEAQMSNLEDVVSLRVKAEVSNNKVQLSEDIYTYETESEEEASFDEATAGPAHEERVELEKASYKQSKQQEATAGPANEEIAELENTSYKQSKQQEVCEPSTLVEAEAPIELELCPTVAEPEWHLLPSVGTWLHAIPRAAAASLHAEANGDGSLPPLLAEAADVVAQEAACVDPETCDKLQSIEEPAVSKAPEAEGGAIEGQQESELVWTR